MYNNENKYNLSIPVALATGETLDLLDRVQDMFRQARWLLPSCQNESPKIFELTGTSASASLYVMLSPGWKCCLFQSCEKLKSARDPPED